MALSFSKHSKFYLSLIFLGAVTSCFRPPEFPKEPSISFENVEFEEVIDIIGTAGVEVRSGVIRLSFNVTDGDGDIGFDGGETGPDFDFVYNNQGKIVQYGERPEDPPFTCIDYLREELEGDNGIDYNNDGDALDTLRRTLNEDRFNFFINFYVKKNGQFEELDFRRLPLAANGETYCGEVPFDSRIPCLSNEDNPCIDLKDNPGPIEGIITYEMKSGLFLPTFRTDTIKLQFQMQDRALNKSNIVESPEFTLQSVKIND